MADVSNTEATTSTKFGFVTRKTAAMVSFLIAFTVFGIMEYSTSVLETVVCAVAMTLTAIVLVIADWAYNTED